MAGPDEFRQNPRNRADRRGAGSDFRRARRILFWQAQKENVAALRGGSSIPAPPFQTGDFSNTVPAELIRILAKITLFSSKQTK
jgi:hypothetical protein